MSPRVDVRIVEGERYTLEVRGHRFETDQPVESGGGDLAPTPTELFVASLAACTAVYAGGYLRRHGLDDGGLSVEARFTMASDRPARVSTITLTVSAPGLPAERIEGFRRVIEHCTVHNSITAPPAISMIVDVRQLVASGG